MKHFTPEQLQELETIYGLKRAEEILPVRDGVVAKDTKVWWRHLSGPEHVVAGVDHWATSAAALRPTSWHARTRPSRTGTDMKTSELTDPALDWAVELAKGTHWSSNGYFVFKTPTGDIRTCGRQPENRYSTDWAQGGPIIEREFIECTVMPCGHSSITFDTWLATIGMPDADMVEAVGPTPLIAAMRCYVTSKLGSEVEVPNELV